MPAKHENYPHWFFAFCQPIKVYEPTKRIMSRTCTGITVEIEDGCEIDHERIFTNGKKYIFEAERGYDGDPSKYTIEEMACEEIDNPRYEAKLKEHKEYLKRLSEWTDLKKRWDKEEEEWKTEVEKQTLAKLKAKYEK